MKIAGIIAEYNPFHEGHLYHLRLTREMTGCDCVIACVTGAFTQRGEMALLDKFARAECALLAGVDAVFELPAVCAVRPAQFFARGGVQILSALGADYLSFGCETDDLNLLSSLAQALRAESPELSDAIRLNLKQGKSFARARGEALSEAAGVDKALINQPNLALALEYLNAISACAPQIKPVVIKRTSDYHSAQLSQNASATAIRAAILGGFTREALALVPACVRGAMSRALDGGVSAPGAADGIYLHALRNLPAERIETLPDAGEGMGARIAKMARESASVEELIANVKCKRYTRARITRAIAGAVLGMPPRAPETPPYLRLLGFRKAARGLLGELAARSGGRVISDAGQLDADEAFQLECRATDLWGLTTQKPEYRKCGRDRTRRFLVV